MKPYSVDLKEKVVNAYQSGNTSVRKLAKDFGVGKVLSVKCFGFFRAFGES
ncbi:hypothetical protein [Chamaesiphon sp. OTE_75_metabat_556]|uniref:hypothetical protein n=1 Tax=Chamaesiphon sp. OTE_75_metabat_556 TaxID=2964692 RepID=UPI00286C9E4C|nr:hypothetical protein [Chamaesiphon sp. OTE_75_metabat_556]